MSQVGPRKQKFNVQMTIAAIIVAIVICTIEETLLTRPKESRVPAEVAADPALAIPAVPESKSINPLAKVPAHQRKIYPDSNVAKIPASVIVAPEENSFPSPLPSATEKQAQTLTPLKKPSISIPASTSTSEKPSTSSGQLTDVLSPEIKPRSTTVAEVPLNPSAEPAPTPVASKEPQTSTSQKSSASPESFEQRLNPQIMSLPTAITVIPLVPSEKQAPTPVAPKQRPTSVPQRSSASPEALAQIPTPQIISPPTTVAEVPLNPSEDPAPTLTPLKELPTPNAQESTNPSEQPPQNMAPLWQKQKIGLQFFIGAGVNFVRYSENLTDVNTNYSDLRGPSLHVGMGMDLTEDTGIEVTYKATPFRFDNSSVSGDDLFGTWQTIVMQGVSKRRRLKGISNAGDEFAWLYGLQIHQVPYALFENATNAAVLRQIQLIDLSLGGRWTRMLNPWTRTVIFLRGQFPISSASAASSFTTSSAFLFDGSIGAEKKFNENLWVGLHWSGQYHQLDFKYNDPRVTAEGTNSTLFSNIEVRLGWDF